MPSTGQPSSSSPRTEPDELQGTAYSSACAVTMTPVYAPAHVMSVVGARPNFMKTAPVVAALNGRPDRFRSTLVHTGHHYDEAMSEIFLEQLGVGDPDHMLEVGSASHAVQTARVMERLEPVLEADRPDLLLVPGDINSRLACSPSGS